MKIPLVAVLFASMAVGPSIVSAAQSAPAHPPHTISNSELRVLPRNAAGRHYQLHVGLPASYWKDTGKRYPVLYVTDGYWDFEKIRAIHGALIFDKVVPEFIWVGLGYAGENLNYDKLRRWELSPVPFGGGADESGHAADFLKTIETEIIPFIEREYRVDSSYRVLGGASLGGLFTLYAMYSKPELFQGYISATPAVVVGNDWLLDYEEKFVKSGKPLKARLYVTAGGNESPGFVGGILRYNQRVASRKHPDLVYRFRIIEDERHSGMQLESYTRGVRFVFEPLAPETGPANFP